MLKFKNIIVILVVFAVTANALPSYIKKCSKKDKNVDECILKSAKSALPEIMKGDAALGIPNLNTYNPADLSIDVGDGIIYKISNIKANPDTLQPTHAKMDFETNTLEIGMHLPHLVWEADFDAKGSNFHSFGKAKITFDDLQFEYTKVFGEKEIDGKTYWQIVSEKTTGTVKQMNLHHDYNEKSSTHCQHETTAAIPKIEEGIKKKLIEICGELVTFVMNTILKSSPKGTIYNE